MLTLEAAVTLRRDHVAGVALLAFSAAVLALGTELPFGTTASPGPGMLPILCVGLMIALAVVLLATARSSPPLATLEWDDLPHALRVLVAAGAAVALYEVIGFLPTVTLLLFVLIFVIERMPLLISLAISIGMGGGAYLLLSTLLKTPLPHGIFGY